MAEIEITKLMQLVEANLTPDGERDVPLYIRIKASKSVYNKTYKTENLTIVLDFDSATNELVGIELI